MPTATNVKVAGNPFAQLVEKAGSTYVQAVIGVLLAGAIINTSTAQAAAIASIPAGLTVVMNGLPLVPVGLPFYVDLALRVVRTYVASFLGLLIAVPVFRLDYSIGTAAAVGAIAPALAVLKGGLAQNVGDVGTASLVRASV